MQRRLSTTMFLVSMHASPLGDLSLCDLPQVVDSSRLAGHSTLRNLSRPADEILRDNSVGCGDCLHTNHTDARVVLTSIVLAISENSQPSLQNRTVVLLDQLPIGLHSCQSSWSSSVLWDSVFVWKRRSIPPDSLAATAIHLDTSLPELASRVVIIPNLLASMKLLKSVIFCSTETFVSALAAL
ncbi:hypothetical protein FJTKL_07796 [Diaporthe vaccinii]|uniref:Secreted protein n=1 Tax=Diaporthe vaccinii TaxID=105482 RepID=A0ABR4FDF2_9PEZI